MGGASSNIILYIFCGILIFPTLIICDEHPERIVRGWQDDDIPPYPISASWFRDRYTAREWNQTLSEFQKIGGDTVWLRAPAPQLRTKEDIRMDPDFRWCGSLRSSSGAEGTDCLTEVTEEVQAAGLHIKAWMTYKYEEDFGPAFLTCKRFDRKINSSRIYHRLVIPMNSTDCNFPPGSDVAVIFTTFSGIDPHQLLVQVAAQLKINVYFGLPAAVNPPNSYSMIALNGTYMNVYFSFVNRILRDHQNRYSSHFTSSNATIKGYYSTDEVCLAAFLRPLAIPYGTYPYLYFYSILGKVVRGFKKQFVLSPYIILNKSQGVMDAKSHLAGFEALANTGVIDVIAVQEGRGAGLGCYYWETQTNSSVATVDPGLLKILQYKDSRVKDDVTFEQYFIGSNNELFKLFADSRDTLKKKGVNFDFWLNVEAFEYLRDDPCLPVDTAGSGMAELLDRTSKSRLDWALTVAGSRPQKVISFAWDSDFTCTTSKYHSSLARQIAHDAGRPIVSECRWHSPQNMSIVVIGYNLVGLTQKFEVHWSDRSNHAHVDSVSGYYFELDYWISHERPEGLMYTQLYDIIDLDNLKDHGHITVKAQGSHHACTFTY